MKSRSLPLIFHNQYPRRTETGTDQHFAPASPESSLTQDFNLFTLLSSCISWSSRLFYFLPLSSAPGSPTSTSHAPSPLSKGPFPTLTLVSQVRSMSPPRSDHGSRLIAETFIQRYDQHFLCASVLIEPQGLLSNHIIIGSRLW